MIGIKEEISGGGIIFEAGNQCGKFMDFKY